MKRKKEIEIFVTIGLGTSSLHFFHSFIFLKWSIHNKHLYFIYLFKKSLNYSKIEMSGITMIQEQKER